MARFLAACGRGDRCSACGVEQQGATMAVRLCMVFACTSRGEGYVAVLCMWRRASSTELRVGHDGEAVARQPGRVGVEDADLVGPSIVVKRDAEHVRFIIIGPLLDLGPVDVVSGKLHAHAAALGVGPRVGGGLDSVDRLDVAEGDAPPVRRRRLGRQAGRADRHQCLGLGGVVVVAAATGPAQRSRRGRRAWRGRRRGAHGAYFVQRWSPAAVDLRRCAVPDGESTANNCKCGRRSPKLPSARAGFQTLRGCRGPSATSA